MTERSVKLLGVETSSSVFSVALCDGERILSSLKIEGQGRPSDFLTDLIEKAVSSAALSLEKLDGFLISIGPGSFTGLRVGVTTVKTLAWALKKKILPVSSLEVITQNFVGSPDPVALFLDARKGKVYTALFSSDGAGSMKRSSEDQTVLPAEALKNLPAKVVLAGDGLKRYGELLSSFPRKRESDPRWSLPSTPIEGEDDISTWELAPEAQWIPSAESLCRIAAGRWPSGVLDDPHRLVPQYLYSKESDITGW